jgi:hypothetical protein
MADDVFYETWLTMCQLGMIGMESSNVKRTETCKTCVHWDVTDDLTGDEDGDKTIVGICRRFPPNLQQDDGNYYQPTTLHSQLCSEFELYNAKVTGREQC